MNEPGTALTVTQRAVIAIGISTEREQELLELAASTKSITAVTNADGREQIFRARMTLKNERVDIEKKCKAARQDATDFQKACLALERRIVGLVQPEEERLQSLQDAWDDVIEAEKQRKIDEEIKRVEAIQLRIKLIQRMPLEASGKTAEHARVVLADASEIIIDESFAEFSTSAREALGATLAACQGVVAEREAAEAEQGRIQAEREELARLRAEAQQREATERARIAEEERKAKVERDAETARQAEQFRQQREEETRLAAQRQAVIDAENARIRAEQAAAQAEIDRQAQEQRDAKQAEQAERARQEEEHRHLNQMRMSEISGIQQQATIAVTGRPGVRKGGTLECIKDTLAETEAWPIEESNFGPLTAVAQGAKDIAIAAIRDSLDAFERKSSLDALEAQQAEVRRQQEEAQRQQAEAARLAAIKKPADTELIKVLADHYRVPASKVREWLRAMKLTQSEAA